MQIAVDYHVPIYYPSTVRQAFGNIYGDKIQDVEYFNVDGERTLGVYVYRDLASAVATEPEVVFVLRSRRIPLLMTDDPNKFFVPEIVSNVVETLLQIYVSQTIVTLSETDEEQVDEYFKKVMSHRLTEIGDW